VMVGHTIDYRLLVFQLRRRGAGPIR
jgi:hypothetical protein